MKLIRRDPSKGYLDRLLWVPRQFINVTATQSALSFLFTDGYTGKQEVLYLWEETDFHLGVPRAFWEPGTLMFDVVDCRPRSYEYIDFKSRIKLDHRPSPRNGKTVLLPTGDNVQRLSIQALNEAMGGVLQLACGKGKTVVALENIAREKVPALIVLDNTNLLHQWEDDIREFLDVPGGVGFLMSGKDDWAGRGIVLATYQTLYARAQKFSEEFKRRWGAVYFDEGHHVNAPTYSISVSLFYGKRFSLTATPERDDGQHIIADFHIGRVLHKDLKPTMIPTIVFKWTGLELNILDPSVASAVMDVNQEIHMSKVKSYFGQWRDRMWMLMQNAIDAMQAGRKVLLLSDSVNEVVNLMTMWTRGPHARLITDIPYPTPAELGETLVPLPLEKKEADKLKKRITKAWKTGGQANNPRYINDALYEWQRFLVHRKLENEYKSRRRAFVKKLINEPSTAGLMTYGVPPKQRQKFLDDRQVVFAITKYGKEGLDCPDLDTILVSSLFSSRNPLQQLMGRPTRPQADKRQPLIVFFVDHVGQCIGMAEKLQKHLRNWPHEEGGPYKFELLDYPRTKSCKISSLKEAFGQ